MASPFYGQFTFEIENLDLFPNPVFWTKFMPAQDGLDNTQIGPTGIRTAAGYLGRGEDSISNKNRSRVSAGHIADISNGVIANVRTGQAQAEIKRNPTIDDQLAANIALRILVYHILVGVDLRGVVQ